MSRPAGRRPARARSQRYLAAHAQRLEELDARRPALFFLVSLRDPERDVATYVSRAAERAPREWLAALRRALLARDRRVLRRASSSARACAPTRRTRASPTTSRPAGARRRAAVARAPRFCRGLGEPRVDGLHEPRALVFERNGEAVLAPLEADVLRWIDSWVEHRGRVLRIESELGVQLAGAARAGRAARASAVSRARARS